MLRRGEGRSLASPPAAPYPGISFLEASAYATGHRGEGRWRLAGSYISTSEMRVKKAGSKLVEEKKLGRKGRTK